jgi:hypothetical protein
MSARVPRRTRAWGRRGLLALVLVFAALSGSCTAGQPKPPRAPSISLPVEAVPPDLDLVVRVDLGKARSALGPEAVTSLRRDAGAALGEARQELVERALELSDTVVLALRPELLPRESDNVLVLSGHFAELGVDRALRQSGWSAPVNLGGDVRRFDRTSRVSRSTAARVYAFADERLVFVSEAEIDSVEAVLERGMAPSTLRPQSRGVLAFAARLRTLGSVLLDRYPDLADAVGPASAVQGTIDSTATGLGLEVALELPTEGAATRTSDALDRIRQALTTSEGKMATMAQNANVQAVGRFAVVRVAVERGML